jgi:phosphoglycerate kinase
MTVETAGLAFIDDLDIADKRLLIRCDFNVPLEDGEITDDFRIRASLPTIEYALEQGARPILCSHLGRPGGEADSDLSLEPVGQALAEMLDVEVVFPEQMTGDSVEYLTTQLDDDQIMLLENLRFDAGEKDGDIEFARGLSRLGDLYINDAFGTAHRKHVSTYWVSQFFDRGNKGAGLLMKKELENLSGLLDSPASPFTALMGGAKVSDKLGVVDKLIDECEHILIGGAMAYTFLKSSGNEVGESLVEADFVDDATKMLRKVETLQRDLKLPLDHLVADDIDADMDDIELTAGADIPEDKAGFDIGERTVDAYRRVIDESETIFWNGPMGVFEKDWFAEGTLRIAEAIAESDAHSVVGGGDSASAVRKAGVLDDIDHVSTGGGAALKVVEGGALPGIDALRPHHSFES